MTATLPDRIPARTGPVQQCWEYKQPREFGEMQRLAGQGWRLHSVVVCGPNVLYVMERPTGGTSGE